jgi:hypothetical protein
MESIKDLTFWDWLFFLSLSVINAFDFFNAFLFLSTLLKVFFKVLWKYYYWETKLPLGSTGFWTQGFELTRQVP